MDSVRIAMDADKVTFEEEQNKLVKFILNERFFKPWIAENQINEKENDLFKDSNLEIFITSSCNQSCKYCYLYNNTDIYPAEINNKDNILNNLQILCNWIKKERFYIPKVSLFSGEIWHSNYGLEVFEILYNNLKEKQWTNFIEIPSNCSFVLNENQLNKIQRYINKFKKINVRVAFSISVDGLIIENITRPLNNLNLIRNEEFYERLFLFAKYNTFYFHPMVSAESVSYWIENVKWWQEMCQKYDMDFEDAVMMLEVRNNDWTEENIKDYIQFLDYLIEEYKIRKCKNKNNEFFQRLLGFKEDLDGYIPYAISKVDTFTGCTIANHLTVRLGDMAICPCHRTAYNKLLYGWFKIENNEIIDIIGNNPQMAIRVLLTNNKEGTLKCDTCIYKELCLRGCYGAQYENVGDPFFQSENMCKFFKEKYYFLIKKYVDMGIIDFLNSYTPYYIFYPNVVEYKKIIQGVLENDVV